MSFPSRRKFVGPKPKEYDFVLFGDEPVLWAAVDYPGVLAGRLPFPNTPDLVEVLTSKNRFLVESGANGLSVPRFEISNDVDEVPAIPERIGFPLVVKRTRGQSRIGAAERLSHSVRSAAGDGSNFFLKTFTGPLMTGKRSSSCGASATPWSYPVLMLAHLRRFATYYLPQNFRQKVKNLLSLPAQL